MVFLLFAICLSCCLFWSKAALALPFGPHPRAVFSGPSGTNGTCNGLAEACLLPLNEMSFAGAHNAGAYQLSCINGGRNTCNAGFLVTDCAYDNQKFDLPSLLEMGVRWLDMGFAGGNPQDGSQPYFVHYGGEFGFAYGQSATEIFNTIGAFLETNLYEVVILSLKRGEEDDSIKHADGPTGYKQLFKILKESLAGPFLLGSTDTSIKVGEIVTSNKRLIVVGLEEIPADVGISTSWYVDSWKDGRSMSDLIDEAESICTPPVYPVSAPVVLEEILPYNGICVETTARVLIKPAYADIFNRCVQSGASVLAMLLDFIDGPEEDIFALINAHIISKAQNYKTS